MFFTEETLKEWRQEALSEKRYINTKAIDPKTLRRELETQDRILQLTQELLDQQSAKKGDTP